MNLFVVFFLDNFAAINFNLREIVLNRKRMNYLNLCYFQLLVSYQSAPLNYASAQKLVAVPAYTQASYRPYVSPTAATAASAYTNAYVQPTGISPVKVSWNLNRMKNAVL